MRKIIVKIIYKIYIRVISDIKKRIFVFFFSTIYKNIRKIH